jgi:hypothetical protein
MDTEDGTWKYTSLVICTVVENNVAIVVSSTPGFANFIEVYIAKMQIIKSLRSSFGGSTIFGSSGTPGTPPGNSKDNHNKPGTERGSERHASHSVDAHSQLSILNSVASAEKGGAQEPSEASMPMGRS